MVKDALLAKPTVSARNKTHARLVFPAILMMLCSKIAYSAQSQPVLLTLDVNSAVIRSKVLLSYARLANLDFMFIRQEDSASNCKDAWQ